MTLCGNDEMEKGNLLVSRHSGLSEEHLATIIADNSVRFINQDKLLRHHFAWQRSASAFSKQERDGGT